MWAVFTKVLRWLTVSRFAGQKAAPRTLRGQIFREKKVQSPGPDGTHGVGTLRGAGRVDRQDALEGGPGFFVSAAVDVESMGPLFERVLVGNKLYVGGLSWNTDNDGLRQAFERFGAVEDVRVITDRETGRSRGFGFVTFSSNEAAQAAISEMDGTSLDGRNIKVNEAEDRPRSGGGGDRRGGGGYERGGYGGSSRW